jgi:hypothetical protein
VARYLIVNFLRCFLISQSFKELLCFLILFNKIKNPSLLHKLVRLGSAKIDTLLILTSFYAKLLKYFFSQFNPPFAQSGVQR